ncbi:hypothetical protein CRM22_006661 [Opisthorchis felineus]|uniref:Uncharacterized protein n=1 Tax=Opisthorchis felineus TaxID=147828 RepID=A0A4S2LST5_OPIFE|nr:hypothetical protein CRM22_006661 [Opisthorchis felineus]
MGGTLSRIFHRKQDDEAKTKVKKPRRFGSLRRQRTEDQETGTRVSRSSTMPSRTQHVRTEDRSTELIGERAEEAQRLEDRREIMRDAMDPDETVTPVAAQHLSAQMPHVKPSHFPEHKEVVPEIKAELPGGFAAVQLVSVTSNDKAIDDVPELRQMTEALHEEEDEPVILNVEDLRHLTNEHEEHIEDIEQKISREQKIEPIMETKKSGEGIPEPITEVSADSAGLAHSEQDLKHKQEEVFTQEDNEHVKEAVDYFHAEGTELEGKSQSAEFLHSETAYDQADEVPIRYETENVQGYAPTVVFETVENSFAEKEENHLKDAHRNEELLGSSKEEDDDYRLITRETPTRQDFEHVSENIFPHDQAESSEEHDKALREDQNEPSDIVEIQYLQEVKQFEKHEQEDEILQGDLVNDEELVEKFPAGLMEHVNIPQEISDVQNSGHPFERDDYDNLLLGDVAHTEDGTKELPTEDAKFENMSQVLDVQYFQQPLEHETRDRLLQEFTEHIEEPVEQLSAKDAEPEGISQEISDFPYFQQPPEQETKDHLLHDDNDHTEGSAEHLPARDADLKDMPQEALDAKHFQQSLEHEVRDRGLHDYGEHTEGSTEHVPTNDTEVEDMTQGALNAENFQHPPELETDHLLQEYTGQPAEEFPTGFARFSDVPQVDLDTQYSGQTNWQEGIDGVPQEVEDDEGALDNSRRTDVSQETLEIQHLEQPPEYDDGDHTQRQDTENVEEPPQGSFTQDIEEADKTQEILDIQYSEIPGQHIPGGDILHSDVERDIVEEDYIPQETLDIQHSEQVFEQESKDISKVESINEEILDEPTDYGNAFIKIVDSQQPEVEGEQQMGQSEGHFESDPMEDSVHQYLQEEHELEPEQALEHTEKPYFENAAYNEETDYVKREHVFEQDGDHLDAESVPPQVGECQSDQTEHMKLDPALSEMSQTGNDTHEDIKSTENTNELQPDQVESAETHRSGSSEPNGSINGLDVGHLHLKQNVPEIVESNGDFDHSIKLPDTRLADQQDFDADISRSPKLTAAGDPPHDEEQRSNGMPISGAEDLI